MLESAKLQIFPTGKVEKNAENFALALALASSSLGSPIISNEYSAVLI